MYTMQQVPEVVKLVLIFLTWGRQHSISEYTCRSLRVLHLLATSEKEKNKFSGATCRYVNLSRCKLEMRHVLEVGETC